METTGLAGAAWWAFRAFAQVAGPAAAAALWQGAALAGALALCLRFAPRSLAADRFHAWAAVFAALVALPFLAPLVSALAGATHMGAAAGGGAFAAAPARPWLDLDPRWTLGIAALWIALSLARAVDLGIHSLRLRGLWRRANVLGDATALGSMGLGAAGASATGLGATGLGAVGMGAIAGRRFEICTTRELDRPSVIGFFRPRILIPEWLLQRLTESELEQVVLHEAEHLRRRDDWTNLFQKICLVLFPLNPALAWIERRLCGEREMACDDAVVRATRAPRAYAACLTSLAERRFERRTEALSLGAWQRRPELAVRVHRILRRTPGLNPAARTALFATVSCGLVIASLELARCPQLVAFAAAPQATIAAPETAAMVPGGATRAVNAAFLADGRNGYKMVDAVARMPISRTEGQAVMDSSQTEAAAFVPRMKARDSRRINSPAFEARAAELRATVAEATEPRIAEPQPMPTAQLAPVRSVDQMNDGRAAEVDTAAVSVAASPQPQPRWVVFTEWEQVESSAGSQAQAATGDAQEQAQEHEQDQPGENANQAPRRVTITRLIWAIYPANRVQDSGNAGSALPGSADRIPASRIPADRDRVPASSAPANPVPANRGAGLAGAKSAGANSISQPAIAPFADGWLVIQL